ncbi:hypothetical protein D3C81_1985390 [compost metagenome]
MARVTQPLLVHFVGVLCQYGTRCTTGIHQLISHAVGTVRIRRNLTDYYGINTQRRPCRRLNFSRSARLLRQTRPV